MIGQCAGCSRKDELVDNAELVIEAYVSAVATRDDLITLLRSLRVARNARSEPPRWRSAVDAVTLDDPVPVPHP